MSPQNLGNPRQIAMIHTVSGLIPLFDGLARLHLPHWQGFNLLDESLRRGTIRDGALSQATMLRLTQMVLSAVDAGASAVVVTCSSLGHAVDAAQPFCPVPLFRIDAGITQAAVILGPRVGVLAKRRRGVATPEGTHQFAFCTEPPVRDVEKLWNIVDVLASTGDSRAVSATQIALAWLPTRPAAGFLVFGGRTEAQFRDNFAAVSLKLTADEIARLTEVSTIPLIYPYWHQRNFATDRFSPADLALHQDFGVE